MSKLVIAAASAGLGFDLHCSVSSWSKGGLLSEKTLEDCKNRYAWFKDFSGEPRTILASKVVWHSDRSSDSSDSHARAILSTFPDSLPDARMGCKRWSGAE